MVLNNLLRWMWSGVECPGTTSSAIKICKVDDDV